MLSLVKFSYMDNYSVDSTSAFFLISGLTIDFPLPRGVTATTNEIPPSICSEIPSLLFDDEDVP